MHDRAVEPTFLISRNDRLVSMMRWRSSDTMFAVWRSVRSGYVAASTCRLHCGAASREAVAEARGRKRGRAGFWRIFIYALGKRMLAGPRISVSRSTEYLRVVT